MNKAGKDIQGTSESTQQSVQTSQAADNPKQAPTFPNLPFGLAVSPKEFRALEAAYHSATVQQDRTDKRKK